jgi:hypothetical protein
VRYLVSCLRRARHTPPVGARSLTVASNAASHSHSAICGGLSVPVLGRSVADHCPHPLFTLQQLRRITKQTLLLGCATIPERVASSAGELRLEEGSALFVPAATPTQLSLRRTLQSPRASGNSMPRIRARSSFSRSAICRTGSTPVKRFGRRPRATSTESLRAFTASSMAGKTLIGSRSRWPTLAISLRC